MRYEATDRIFVAMPFSGSFRRAFERVIEPAIKQVSVNGRQLVPRIINRGTSGSPDIHEQIFDAILHSRLVIADMTVRSSFVGDDGTQKWQANANVAYEVGLASAWRNPEDILQDEGMPIMDARIHAATELLSYGALKNRHVLPQGPGKGVAVIYEWTELGLRMLLSLHAITAERSRELREQIASVPLGTVPPPALRDLPEVKPPEKGPIDMVDAAKVDTTNEAAATK